MSTTNPSLEGNVPCITCVYPGKSAPKSRKNLVVPSRGEIHYIPIIPTSVVPVPAWDRVGVTLSYYLLWGFHKLVQHIGEGYYIVGPVYQTKGRVADCQLSITGKTKSLVSAHGPVNWRSAFHESWIEAITRELSEELGLMIKPSRMKQCAQRTHHASGRGTTVVNILLTGDDIQLYDPREMRCNFPAPTSDQKLVDNPHRRIQIVLAVRATDFDKLGGIDNVRRPSGDTGSISGMCVMPCRRFHCSANSDRCDVIFNPAPSSSDDSASALRADAPSWTPTVVGMTIVDAYTSASSSARTPRTIIAKGPVHGSRGFTYPRSVCVSVS